MSDDDAIDRATVYATKTLAFVVQLVRDEPEPGREAVLALASTVLLMHGICKDQAERDAFLSVFEMALKHMREAEPAPVCTHGEGGAREV